MLRTLFRNRAGEGVASWVPFAAIVAVLALIMSMLALTPSQALAEEVEPTGTATTERVAETSDAETPPQEEAGTPTETDSAETDTAPGPANGTEPAGEATSETDVSPLSDLGIGTFAINPGIQVDVTTIENTSEVDPDTQLVIGDSALVSGTWNATNADPQPGDQFEVELPPELRIDALLPTFSLGGDAGSGVSSWGECVINDERTAFECTLADVVADYEEIQGTWMIETIATTRYTEETINFTINGVTEPVDLPGEGGISDGFEFGETQKTGQLRADKQSALWTIEVPGPVLAELDTDNDGVVTLTDELSANMTLCEPAQATPTLEFGRESTAPVPGGSVTIEETDATAETRTLSLEINNNGPFETEGMYEIEYVTCTTSGEVERGEAVEYTNYVDINGTQFGEGIGQDWAPATQPAKNGGFVSDSRYGALQWTVFVPGSFLQGTDDLTIEDQLSDNHSVCEAGNLNIRVQEQDRLPGLGETGRPWRDTAGFNVTNTAEEGDRDFVITVDGAEFDEDKNYRVIYNTCVDMEEIPDNEVVFGNTADINGTVRSATQQGYTFSSGKSGSINYSETIVAGEPQPAGSTSNWDITVSGYDLEALDSDLTVTDTFSDTLAVCEVEGGSDLKDRLNLSVTARDVIDAGVTENWTERTEVSLHADGALEFTLPYEDGRFNRNWVFDIEYTLCTSSGGVDADGTQYSNEADILGSSYGGDVSLQANQMGTGTGVSRGSFSLTKDLHWESESFDTDAHEFTVRVEEFAPGDFTAGEDADRSYDIRVKANGEPVSGQFARGEGWTIRLSEVGFPTVPGLYFEPGQFQETEGVTVSEDGTQAWFTIDNPRTNAAVELENTARLGGMELTKEVIGDAAGQVSDDELFEVTAYIDEDADGQYDRTATNSIRNGQTWNIPDLPIGTVVTFSEDQPENSDSITWGAPVFEPNRLVISDNQEANAVTLTNTANATEGTFSVQKELTGPEAYSPNVPESFDVMATWVDTEGVEQSETLEVSADGAPTNFGEMLPAGTQVTLTENVPADGDGLAWSAPTFSGEGVTIDEDGNAVVTVGLAPVQVTVNNHVEINDGTLRVLKSISGEAAEGVGEDVAFPVTATWQEGNQWRTVDLMVRNGEATPLGVDLPVGTPVTFTEGERPLLDGIEWGAITWGTNSDEEWLRPNPGGSATGIVSDDVTEGRLITLSNEAAWGPRTATLEKLVVGDAADELTGDEVFEVTINVDEDADGTVDYTIDNQQILAGEPVELPEMPVGAVLTFSEIMPTNTDVVTWGEPVFEPETLTINPDQSANIVTVTNAAEITQGTFSVQKQVTGDEADNPAVPESFEVTATWGENESETLTVPTNGDAVSYDGEIPAGTVVTLAETLPEDGEGIAWGTPEFAGAGVTVEDGQAQFTIGLDPVTVTIQNTANDHVGDLHIQKTVEGEAAAAAEGANFEVTAQIDRPAGEQDESLTWTLQDGQVWELIDLPVGTEVTFSEALPADTDQVTWGEPTFAPSNTVVVGDDSEATLVTLTNTANVTEGTFSLYKELEGPEQDNPNVPDTFDVTATWVDAEGVEQSRDIELPADGSVAEFGEDLVSGTEVTLTENVPADGNGIAWAAPSFSGEGVSIDEDGNAVVTIGLDPVAVTISNHVDVNDGTLRIIKRVGGEAAEGVDEDAEFTVTATWREGTEFRETELSLRDGEAVGLGAELPVGTEVTFTEGERPETAGVEWGAITWSTNEANDSWLRTNPDGTATGIVTDNSEAGSLITLGNEAQWMPGSIGFEKLIELDGETVPATEADLPEGTEFDIQIDSIQVPEGQNLPADAGIAAGDVITLNAENDYRWDSESVLPRGTVVTFTEIEPQPVDGFDWGLASYENTITVEADGAHQVEIINRAIPTTDVEIDKVVTGLKGGAVENHDSTLFQVTASWTDIDGFDRSCVLNVVPGQPAVPTTDCDANIVDGTVQFPVNTEITFTETGAYTEVSNVNWGEVIWSVEQGMAEVEGIEGEGTAATVTLTGDPNEQVTLGLENRTTSNGLIIIPIPIPLPPFEGGSSFPPGPDPQIPVDPGAPGGEQPGEPGGEQPGEPGEQSPQDPDRPGEPDGQTPEHPGKGTPGTPGDPAAAKPVTAQDAGQDGPQESKGQGGLAETGANVAWLAGAALLLIIGGAWLALRGRKNGA